MPQHNQSVEQTQSTGFSRFITAAFDAWVNAGVDFIVLRNYDGLPYTTSNDIDVLVAKHQLNLAEQTLISIAADQGYTLVNRAEFVPVSLHFANLDTTDQIHFDLFTEMRWHSFEFIRCRDFLSRKLQRANFFIPHPADEACTNLLGFLIYHKRVRDKYKPRIVSTFQIYANAARARLAESYGEKLAHTLVKLVVQKDWPGIEALAGKLRRTLLLRLFSRRPFQTTTRLATDAARFMRRLCQPAGFMIVLLGPDGCGKSTIANLILNGLAGTFYTTKSAHFHWKPKLLQRKEDHAYRAVTKPHSQPQRNLLLSLLFFWLHWGEFVLGSILKIWPVIFRGGLVLIERYYYDFFVDQIRYRLRVPKFLVQLGFAFVKKPDLVLLLDAPVEVLRSRKQEVSPDETQRQRNAYLDLVSVTKNAVVINANQLPEQVAKEAVRAILVQLATRAQRRLRHRTQHNLAPESKTYITSHTPLN